MSRNTFEEKGYESFLYITLTHGEADRCLISETPGTFLLRGCTSQPGAYVICIKEHDTVRQYKINVNEARDEFYVRSESKFSDLESLLAFYKRHAFTDTPLWLPIDPAKVPKTPKSPRPLRVKTEPGVGGLRTGLYSPSIDTRYSEGDKTRYARVTRSSHTSVYDESFLDLNVGDIVKIKRLSPNGELDVEIDGRCGKFPFTAVELIKDP